MKSKNSSINTASKSDRERRLENLELQYESILDDPENVRQIDELRFKISGLIGKNNLNLLREYTDRLIVLYNIDAGWFYMKGYEDAMSKKNEEHKQ